MFSKLSCSVSAILMTIKIRINPPLERNNKFIVIFAYIHANSIPLHNSSLQTVLGKNFLNSPITKMTDELSIYF